jgi:hypothetical protein
MIGLLALALAGACGRVVKKDGPYETTAEVQARRELADHVVAGWADDARFAARALLEKYGAPDEVHSSRIVWSARGPWKKTTVHDAPPPYAGSETAELEVVEQTLAYPLKPEQADLLKPFGRTLAFDSVTGELTVRSDRESVNFLRVNLADEVVTGRLTAEQAKEAHARILALEAAGKATGYTTGLRFAPELGTP